MAGFSSRAFTACAFASCACVHIINLVRIVAAGVAIVSPNFWSLGVLLVAHVLTVVRWLGSFNGGSDYMSSLLLLFTFIGSLWPDTMGTPCLWFIAIQLCYSYFKAGLVKVRNQTWRRGEAISRFVLSPIYSESKVLSWVFASRVRALLISWVTILFELLFPLAIFDQRLAIGFMGLAIAFHLANAYVFGLNRFVFAWAAAYPALYWCAA